MDSSQNSHSNRNIAATVFAVLAGLALLFWAARCTPFLSSYGINLGESGDVEVAASPVGNVDSAPATAKAVPGLSAVADENAKLRDQVEDLEDELEAHTANSAPPQKAEVAAAPAISTDALGQLRSDKANALSQVASLTGNNTSLEEEARKAREAAAASATALESQGAQLDQSQTRVTELEQQLLDARKEAEEAARRAAAEQAAREAAERARAEALTARANAAIDTPAPEPTPEPEVAATPQEPASVFVTAENLAPTAGALFRDLEIVHDPSSPLYAGPVARAYGKAAKPHGGKLVRSVSFGSGMTNADSTDIEAVAELAKNAPENHFFLVVGYADTTGNSDANQRIAQARATSVAGAITQGLGSNDRVQAAYLGETARFDQNDLGKNRVVEVWEITPTE